MYQVIIKKQVEKQLEKIPRNYFRSISKSLDKLSFNPRPSGCKKLTNFDGLYRIKVGNYRVIYLIEDDKLIIEIIKIGHRQSIYK